MIELQKKILQILQDLKRSSSPTPTLIATDKGQYRLAYLEYTIKYTVDRFTSVEAAPLIMKQM
jgi:hypothetical protein